MPPADLSPSPPLSPAAKLQPNRVELQAVVQGTEGLRYTPAGIAVVDAVLMHVSEQQEAGVARRVELEVMARFAGPIAQRMNAVVLGSSVLVRGFLAPRRRQSKQLVLHVNEFELIEV